MFKIKGENLYASILEKLSFYSMLPPIICRHVVFMLQPDIIQCPIAKNRFPSGKESREGAFFIEKDSRTAEIHKSGEGVLCHSFRCSYGQERTLLATL